MMQSPIPDTFWRYVFHGTFAVTAAAATFSIYSASRRAHYRVEKDMAALKSREPDVQLDAVRRILDAVEDDLMQKNGCASNVVADNFHVILPLLKVPITDDDDNVAGFLIPTVLKLLRKVCSGENDVRDRLFRANAHRYILGVLQTAHKAGSIKLMEDAAGALRELTQTEEYEVVLDGEVPDGSLGALRLSQMSSTPTMFRTLDPTARVSFLSSMTGIFANVAAIRAGALVVSKGFDGKPGTSFFVTLLSHGNANVVENAARTVRSLVRHGGDPVHRVVCAKDAVQDIVDLLEAHRETRTVMCVLFTVRMMVVQSSRSAEFLKNFVECGGVAQLFHVWTRGGEKPLRDRAESLVQMLQGQKVSNAEVMQQLDMNRSAIQERKQKDAEMLRKHQQQMKQQAMFQQMMMGGGGMPEDMMEMMGGME